MEKELLCRMVRDDRAAFEVIYHQYFRAVYENALKITRDTTIAEDVLQEVFITLWEKRKSLDTNRSVGGWLFVICYNKSINQLRKKLMDSVACQKLRQITADATSDDEITLYDLQWEIVEKAIAQLSPQKRKVFELCKIYGKTYEETAAILDISKHTVKEYLMGALSLVKKQVRLQPDPSITVTVFLFFHLLF